MPAEYEMDQVRKKRSSMYEVACDMTDHWNVVRVRRELRLRLKAQKAKK